MSGVGVKGLRLGKNEVVQKGVGKSLTRGRNQQHSISLNKRHFKAAAHLVQALRH
jgi:hypothetical protein